MSVANAASIFSDYGARQALKVAFGLSPDPPPTHLYLALSSTPINRDGSGITEPSGGGYARALIPPWIGPFDDEYGAGDYFLDSHTIQQASRAPGVVFHPSADIVFPVATAPWNLFTSTPFLWMYLGIFDAPTGGNLIWRLYEDEPGYGGPPTSGFPTPLHPLTVTSRQVATGQQLRFGATGVAIGFSNVTEEGSDSWPFIFSGGAASQSDAFWVPVLKHMLGITAFASPSWSVGLAHSASYSSPSRVLPPFTEPNDPAYSRKPLGTVSGPTDHRTDLPGIQAPRVTAGGWSWTVGAGFAAGYRDCFPMLYDGAGNWAWLIGAGNTNVPSDGDTITVPANSVAFQAW